MELITHLCVLQDLLFESIQEGRYDFPEREWGSISTEAKDLIQRLLVKEASRRLSAAGVLEHTWVKNGPSPDAEPLNTPQVIRRWGDKKNVDAITSIKTLKKK